MHILFVDINIHAVYGFCNSLKEEPMLSNEDYYGQALQSLLAAGFQAECAAVMAATSAEFAEGMRELIETHDQSLIQRSKHD